jgi:hypothetical protein
MKLSSPSFVWFLGAAGSWRRWLSVLATVTLLGLSPSSLAHHSFSMYDSEKLLQLDGIVKEFQWTNPHAILWVTGTTAPNEAPVLWTVELPTSPGNLSRMGWKRNSLSPGDRVVVELNPLRDGRRGGSFKKATLALTGAVLVAAARDEPPSAGAAADHDADHDEHEHPGGSSCALRSASATRPPLSAALGLALLALAGCQRRSRSARRYPRL